MASNIPAAIIAKMRPIEFRVGERDKYFESLEYAIGQIQGQVGVESGVIGGVGETTGAVDPVNVVNAQAIDDNAEAIEQNAQAIQQNASDISDNANAIQENANDIAVNVDGISDNQISSSAAIAMIAELYRAIFNGEYEPIFGAGDPNVGAVLSNFNRQYFDLSIPSHWVNPDVGATSGWVQVV